MEEDRREFLKKFALLSSVPILFSGCPNTVYGPPPNSENNDTETQIEKNIIYYIDREGNSISLYNKYDVPIDLTINVTFPNKMNRDAENNVYLMNDKDELVSCVKKWEGDYILELKPIENSIDYDSSYTLTIDDSIQDREGNLLDKERYLLIAKFRTMSQKKS